MRKTSVVVVAETAKLDRSKELAGLMCKDCDNTTVVQASLAASEPFCSHCGSDQVVPTEVSSLKSRTLLRAKDDELANVKCTGCSSHIIMTAAQATALGDEQGIGHINCSACSSEIAFHAPTEVAGDDDEDEWDAPKDESDDEEENIESDLDDSEDDEDKEPQPQVTVMDGDDELLAEGELVSRDGMTFSLKTDTSDDSVVEVYTVSDEDDIDEDDEGNITLSNAEISDEDDNDEADEADKEDDDEDTEKASTEDDDTSDESDDEVDESEESDADLETEADEEVASDDEDEEEDDESEPDVEVEVNVDESESDEEEDEEEASVEVAKGKGKKRKGKKGKGKDPLGYYSRFDEQELKKFLQGHKAKLERLKSEDHGISEEGLRKYSLADRITDEEETLERISNSMEEQASIGVSASTNSVEVASVESEVTLLQFASLDETPVFEAHGDIVLCKVGDLTVATCSDIDGSAEGFTRALNVAVKDASRSDLTTVLDANGFDVPNVLVTEDAHVTARINSEREQLAQEATAATESMGDTLKQSLGIAMAGLNRGFFGKGNPQMTAMVAALEKAGMKPDAARQEAASIFTRTADDYADVLREQALLIFNKSDDNRNELASTILEVNINPETASVGDKLERDLSTPLRDSTAAETASINGDDAAPKAGKIASLASKSPLFQR